MTHIFFLMASISLGVVVYWMVMRDFRNMLERKYAVAYDEIELDMCLHQAEEGDGQLTFALPEGTVPPAMPATDPKQWGQALLVMQSRKKKHTIAAVFALVLTLLCGRTLFVYTNSPTLSEIIGLVTGGCLALAITYFLKRKERVLFFGDKLIRVGISKTKEYPYADIRRIKFLKYKKGKNFSWHLTYGKWICEIVMNNGRIVVLSSKDYENFQKITALWHANLTWV